MSINKDLIRQLREITSAGIIDCKNALNQAGGDLDKAKEILRKKGANIALRKAARPVKEGVVDSYKHFDGKIGALVEVDCETDFVARSDEFKQFVKDVAMQIAATNPLYIKREDIPKELLDKEPAELDNFYREVCLLEQPFIKDQSITIGSYLTSIISKVGENMVIKRFVRYQVGEKEE